MAHKVLNVLTICFSAFLVFRAAANVPVILKDISFNNTHDFMLFFLTIMMLVTVIISTVFTANRALERIIYN